MTTPTLMVSGGNDKQVNPERVRDFYADIGSPQKVFIDLGCSSHNAMWEKNHLILFKASLEWLEKGTVEGQSNTMLKLGRASPHAHLHQGDHRIHRHRERPGRASSLSAASTGL